MEKNRNQLSREQQRQIRAAYERKRKERMNNEQTQERLFRRRENYKKQKERRTNVNISNNLQPRVPSQHFTIMNFPRSHFQGTHDHEAGPSNVTRINDATLGGSVPSNLQETHDNEEASSGIDINDIVHDSMEFDENFDEAQILEVALEGAANVTSSRHRRQGRSVPSNFQETDDNEAASSGIDINDIVHDSMEFDETQILEVALEGAANVTSSRRRRQDNIRYREIFQLCHELKTKKFDAYFDNHEGDFQKRWNTWKDEQSISSINKVDNKVHRLRVYSVGWGATVITDKTQLWNMVKREILSQRTTRNIQNVAASISNHSHKSFKLKQDISILQFFKSKQFIDKAIYGELVRIFARILE
ncbi:uncharacterized protein LOC123885165 isoform X2 [Trifolium pratense]|uniref:uncharacterized protein LOC123885165 isoform X2 n=1 Tax=Trifolium pratense TaxID=57577 RepID=UPI001E6909CC|nr:uncharacterized protein LOC123885165 isoform X2 [Trifolium pratense]